MEPSKEGPRTRRIAQAPGLAWLMKGKAVKESVQRTRAFLGLLSVLVSGLACLSGVSTATGLPFAGGTGEPNDPYRIATVQQLVAIGSDTSLLSKHFVLVADIDLDPNLPGPGVFTQAVVAPLSQSPFAGGLDGAGHVIRNLTVYGLSDVGLFGYVAASGTVANLGLENATIVGGTDVGALAAHNEGSLSMCHSTGSVSGRDTVGGLAGTNSGMITSCHSAGSVTGPLVNAGGLVGENDGTVSSCYSTARVTGSGEVGGLVGHNLLFGSIVCCYSTGSVSGDTEVGGLAGSDDDGTITSCYSTGTVTGWGAIGGLVGYGDSQIAGSYFLARSDGGGSGRGWGTALDAGQMTQQGSFVGFDFWGTRLDGSSDDWFMPQDSPPILVWQTEQTGLQAIPDIKGLTPEDARRVLEQAGLVPGAEVQTDYDRSIPQGLVLRTYPPSFAAPGGTVELVLSLGAYVYDWATNPGKGTAARPYQIWAASQLDSLSDHPELWGMHFVLSADVDMAGRVYSKALIAQDVDGSKDGFQGTAFTGSFDGLGFKILNLSITTRTGDYLGLFGFIAKGAVVRAVDLENIWIRGGTGTTYAGTGSDYVGTVAGYNAGTIADCSAGGTINGHSHVGSVAGGNSGVVENCHTEEVSLPIAHPWPAD